MSGRGALLWVTAAGVLLAACAPIPPPDSLVELDRVRDAPAAREAAQYAPPAFEHAEQLRREAQAAFDDGRIAAAQILAERARAAYAHAVALSRVVRAEQAQAAAEADADAAERELAEIDAEHQGVAADISALELRLKVLKDAQPIVPSGSATAGREQARVEAVAALRLQARLLCVAARLLEQPAASTRGGGEGPLRQAQRQLTALEQRLAGEPGAAPIDQAMRVRAACLRALTSARRAPGRPSGASGSADALLTRLSEMGHGSPSRDDRGVVVTLRNIFAGETLTAAGRRALAELGKVAAEHPAFPMMLVLHQAQAGGPADDARWQRRADAVTAALGDTRVAVELAGTARPVVDPAGKYARRNERVEIVFVAPSGP